MHVEVDTEKIVNKYGTLSGDELLQSYKKDEEE